MVNTSNKVLVSFNKLVYEYLVKMNFKQTAEVFKKEAQVQDIRLNENIPTLLNWYNIFVETSNVRGGNTVIPESLNRIEVIMKKLESERNKNSQMIDKQDGINENEFEFERKTGYKSEMYKETEHSTKLKEFKSIDLKLPYVYLCKFCPQTKVLILACADNKIYFYNLAKNTIEGSMLIKTRKIQNIIIKETHKDIFFAYEINGHSLIMLKYSDGIVNEIKTIDTEHKIISNCFVDNYVVVLFANSIIRVFSISGEFIKQFEMNTVCKSLETFENNILVLKEDSLVKLDKNMGIEIKTCITGKPNAIVAKDGYLFVFYLDQIQVFKSLSQTQPTYVTYIENGFTCKDITWFNKFFVACLENDLLYCNVKLKAPNTIAIYKLSQHENAVLMLITSNAKISFIN